MPTVDHALLAARGAATPSATTSVVIVDPHPGMRDGLALLLPPEGMAVLGSASTGAGGEALIARHEPDVALVAADLPDVGGIALVRRLVHRGLRSAVVLYADDADCEDSAAAVNAGAAGLVAKRRSIGELAEALRSVATGGLWFEERDDELLAPPPAPAAPLPLPPQQRRTSTLSSSELRVLALVAEGGSTEATAEALSLSPHTVRTHMRNVMRKLEASSRAHAVAIAIREAAIEI
ncbi:MAG: response regulator transcription factor [Actinobacteria bacterium]|nr:response regulator transcription factor [Actinomycetota bacterium]